MSTERPLRVVIDSRLRDGEPGGVQQIVIGLACGLSRTGRPGAEEFLFLTWRGQSAWLRPFVHGSCRIVEMPASRVRAAGRWMQKRVAATGLLGVRPTPAMRVAASDSGVLALAPDVIHFPLQRAFRTAVPSIYQPHDLQHIHLPEYFSRRARESRDLVYREYCRQASAVVVMSEWGRNDIVHQFGLPGNKVAVIPWAPMLPEYGPPEARLVESVRRECALPPRFAYFPAHTYPHKNHVGLFGALARLRASGLDIPLVCSGGTNEYYPVIRAALARVGLDDRVTFVGFVSPAVVTALYHACHAVLFPSLFEGWGLPLGEAFAAGVPVACSSVTCLPEQADGGARLFDPRDEAGMAGAIAEIWTDEPMRRRLAARGRDVAARYSWDRTANAFRQLYSTIAVASGATTRTRRLEAARS